MIIDEFLNKFTSKGKVSIPETRKILFGKFKEIYPRVLILIFIIDLMLYLSISFSDYQLKFIPTILLILLMNLLVFIGVFVSVKKSLEYPLKSTLKSEIDKWLITHAKLNHSSQYFQFSKSLTNELHNYKSNLNIGWIGPILLSIWTVIITLILQESPNYLIPTLIITFLLVGMLFFLNKSFELMYNELFTSRKYRYDRYQKAIKLIEELGIQKSIDEHRK